MLQIVTSQPNHPNRLNPPSICPLRSIYHPNKIGPHLCTTQSILPHLPPIGVLSSSLLLFKPQTTPQISPHTTPIYTSSFIEHTMLRSLVSINGLVRRQDRTRRAIPMSYSQNVYANAHLDVHHQQLVLDHRRLSRTMVRLNSPSRVRIPSGLESHPSNGRFRCQTFPRTAIPRSICLLGVERVVLSTDKKNLIGTVLSAQLRAQRFQQREDTLGRPAPR
ncbi:hypothetical protein B9Z19DRAFT_197737 [Tuber borchii]|uniref:Uncharacterized protein n=1 Tax=Tuber borchii TaxID=42251 RepID=A0A2T6ZNX5_TUBBO|nr:hypothetical protein B9Z19DRAFT_197737 [Tuber borchii]